MLSQICRTLTRTHTEKNYFSPSEEFGNVLFLVAFCLASEKSFLLSLLLRQLRGN